MSAADSPQPAEPKVDGIARADYQAWRHHPVSQLVLRYLGDKRQFLERVVMEKFVAGELRLGSDEGQTLRGQIIELAEMVEMPFEALVEFYREEEEAHVRPGADRRA